MKPTTITKNFGGKREKMTVSVNMKKRTATIITYYEDGKPCGKYRACCLDKQTLYYYDGGTASFNDWICFLRSGEFSKVF